MKDIQDILPSTESLPKTPESFSKRHGGPYDRGSADAYYRRSPEPHYFVGSTGSSERISEERMTPEEISAYFKGYNEEDDRKEW